ncbi:hypothetical protein D9O50_05120 [Oxalobacteraceae bacterium CAVE-383]|nr:hypothetical protein D9O50_05120 [Oxalobacteraceae bacterium CAVE-383]
MYIVAIAWLYVVFMMSITEQTAVAGVMTFLLYGALPLTIVLYLMDTPRRKRNRQMPAKNETIPHQAEAVPDAPGGKASGEGGGNANFPAADRPKS